MADAAYLISVGLRTLSVVTGLRLCRIGWLCSATLRRLLIFLPIPENAELPRGHDELSLPAKDLISTTDVYSAPHQVQPRPTYELNVHLSVLISSRFVYALFIKSRFHQSGWRLSRPPVRGERIWEGI